MALRRPSRHIGADGRLALQQGGFRGNESGHDEHSR
jgi:hypothetical protein